MSKISFLNMKRKKFSWNKNFNEQKIKKSHTGFDLSDFRLQNFDSLICKIKPCAPVFIFHNLFFYQFFSRLMLKIFGIFKLPNLIIKFIEERLRFAKKNSLFRERYSFNFFYKIGFSKILQISSQFFFYLKLPNFFL